MKLSDRGLIYYNTQEYAVMNNKTLKKDRSCTVVSRNKFEKATPESKLEALEIEACCKDNITSTYRT